MILLATTVFAEILGFSAAVLAGLIFLALFFSKFNQFR
jgi:hypothetical protein